MEERARILVVDDEEVIREVIADFLSMEDFSVQTAADGRQAIAELDRGRFDLVLSDLKMPHVGGLELLEEMQRRQLKTKAVIMTGFGTIETAIEAMKRGAHDYILKPFRVEE
ncbi:MAG: response regulator, partial [Polyangiales bacterium]